MSRHVDEIKRMKKEIEAYKNKYGEIKRQPDTVSTDEAKRASDNARNLVNYIVRYVKACDDSNIIVDLPSDHQAYVNSFTDEIQTMQGNSEYRHRGQFIQAAVDTINKRQEYSADRYLRRLALTMKGGAIKQWRT